jgi:hypothetical protein
MDLKTISKELRVLQGMAKQSMERLKALTEKLGTAHQKLVETAAKLHPGKPSEEAQSPSRKVSSTLSMAPWPEWDD